MRTNTESNIDILKLSMAQGITSYTSPSFIVGKNDRKGDSVILVRKIVEFNDYIKSLENLMKDYSIFINTVNSFTKFN